MPRVQRVHDAAGSVGRDAAGLAAEGTGPHAAFGNGGTEARAETEETGTEEACSETVVRVKP